MKKGSRREGTALRELETKPSTQKRKYSLWRVCWQHGPDLKNIRAWLAAEEKEEKNEEQAKEGKLSSSVVPVCTSTRKNERVSER